jgi:hypothetical protein
MKDTSATAWELIPRAEPVRVEGRQRRLQGSYESLEKNEAA